MLGLFLFSGSAVEHLTASSSSTWRNIVQRCVFASKIQTAIATTAASSRAHTETLLETLGPDISVTWAVITHNW